MQKWNYETGEYESYPVPDDWDCRMVCDDMHEIINCAGCGKKLEYGDSYTSFEIHNHIGLGYCVCGKCHVEEMIRNSKYQEDM